MLSIRFEGLRFATLEALSDHIVKHYGSWRQVPDNHQEIAIVEALCVHNPDLHYVHDGIVYCTDPLPALYEDE